MKKLGLCFILFVSLLITGCSNKIDEEGSKIYTKAIASMMKMSSSNVNISFLMDMEEGMIAKLETDLKFKTKPSVQVMGSMSIAASGVKVDDIAKYYVKDNTLYVDALGDSKVAIPLATLQEKYFSQFNESLQETSVDKTFKELTMEQKDDKYYLHMVINKAIIDSINKSGNENIVSSLDMKMSIKNYEIDMVVNKASQIEECTITMDPTYTINDETKSGNIKVTITFGDIDKVEDIKFPSFKGFIKGSDDQLNDLLKNAEQSSTI